MSNWLSTCRSCGQTIAWDTTRNGKRVPIDPDGRIHFGSCPARLFRKGKRNEGQTGIPVPEKDKS